MGFKTFVKAGFGFVLGTELCKLCKYTVAELLEPSMDRYMIKRAKEGSSDGIKYCKKFNLNYETEATEEE